MNRPLTGLKLTISLQIPICFKLENYVLNVINIKVKSKHYVKFHGIEPNNNLLFDKHIASLCNKEVNQLHALLCRIQNQMGKNQNKIFMNSFVYSNFNYSPLVWDFSTKKLMRKIDKIQRRYLRKISDDYTGQQRFWYHVTSDCFLWFL